MSSFKEKFKLWTRGKSSLNLREASNDNKDKSNRYSLNTDNKYVEGVSGSSINTSSISKISSGSAETGAGSTKKQSFEQEDKDMGTEKDTRQQNENGALHKCINELAASFGTNSTTSDNDAVRHLPLENIEESEIASSVETVQKPLKTNAQKASSHFVTVIEVKESKTNMDADLDSGLEGSESVQSTTTPSLSSFERKISTKVEPTAPPLSPALTSPSMTASSYATHADNKKKMPPRPPPKNIRRVEPPTIPGQLSSSPKRDTPYIGSSMPLPSASGNLSSSDSPGNSLERNLKPSAILRQKSPESMEGKALTSNRKTTSDLGKFNPPDLMEELGRKVGKSESLEKTKRSDMAITQSPTGSLGRTVSIQNRNVTGGRTSGTAVGVSPTGSLSKPSKLAVADSSSTNSLEKKSHYSLQAADAENSQTQVVGSKESLASQGISEIIKSYESVSSLGSDCAKVAVDNEPYYDTVPLDNGEGEYVYIKPGGNGSSSSRDDLSTPGSTLPIGSATHLSSQASVTDPESPGRSSNYVNIDYFLHQSNETRSSSLDSDGEYEGPPIMRTISHDDQNSQTPSALRKVIISVHIHIINMEGSHHICSYIHLLLLTYRDMY
uniref:Uncharacterized protein n=1 Tax=Bactrocera latifrons TaxID=174628 RepID=A0A0K8TVM6_BACLA